MFEAGIGGREGLRAGVRQKSGREGLDKKKEIQKAAKKPPKFNPRVLNFGGFATKKA